MNACQVPSCKLQISCNTTHIYGKSLWRIKLSFRTLVLSVNERIPCSVQQSNIEMNRNEYWNIFRGNSLGLPGYTNMYTYIYVLFVAIDQLLSVQIFSVNWCHLFRGIRLVFYFYSLVFVIRFSFSVCRLCGECCCEKYLGFVRGKNHFPISIRPINDCYYYGCYCKCEINARLTFSAQRNANNNGTKPIWSLSIRMHTVLYTVIWTPVFCCCCCLSKQMLMADFIFPEFVRQHFQ